MGRNIRLILAAIVAVSSIGVAGYLYANHFGVAQFIAMRISHDKGMRIINPLGVEQYAMAIIYQNDQDFLWCQGELLSPHDIGYIDSIDDRNTNWNPGHAEIISAPTGNSAKVGVVSHNYGVMVSQGGGAQHGSAQGIPIHHALFSIKGPSQSAATDCVCDEVVNDLGSDRKQFFANFGIRCP